MFKSFKPFVFLSSDGSSKYQIAEQENYDSEEGYDGEEESYEDEAQNAIQLAPNQVCVTLSYTLMNQVKQMARMEGVSQQDMILELLAESLTRRSYEDASKPMPSHLMTRSGYMGPDANGNQMTSHQQQYGNQQNGNRRQHNGNQRRNNFNGNGFHKNNFNGNNGNRYNNKNGNRFQARNYQGQNQQQSASDQQPASPSTNTDKE